MKKICSFSVFTVLFFIFFLTTIITYSDSSKANVFIVDNFEHLSVNLFPWGWTPYKRKGYKIMRILKEGNNRYLRINSKNDGVYVGKPLYLDKSNGRIFFKHSKGRIKGFLLKKYQYLSWRWRVHVLPKGGSEKYRSKNDSGAAVAVIFKNRLIGAFSLKYVWSNSLPEGTILPSPGFMGSSTRIIVLRSGKKGIKKWHRVKRNIYKDYIKAFGKVPDRPSSGIAFLTDSDDTDSIAIADYDDIILSQK